MGHTHLKCVWLLLEEDPTIQYNTIEMRLQYEYITTTKLLLDLRGVRLLRKHVGRAGARARRGHDQLAWRSNA